MDFEIPELKADFVFSRRPLAIPGDLRPTWRIALIVLLLKNCCRGGRSSFARLHVLSWGIRTLESQSELKAAAEGDIPLSAVIVRFDPFLDRAIDFAIGEKLVIHRGGKLVELTEDGRRLAAEVQRDRSLLAIEKDFMSSIRYVVSETLVNQMFGRRA